MTGIRNRLAKLERIVSEASAEALCKLCWGQPYAVLIVVHEVVRSDSKIIGFRETGEIYLAEDCVGRFTEDLHDLRCVGCGTKARRATVMYTPGVGPWAPGIGGPELRGKKLVA